MQATPARADKDKNYKYGAFSLVAVGAYLLSKGKTVEGAAVVGAGAYAYKKGEFARKADKYGYRYGDRYGTNTGGSYNYNNGTRYGDRYNYNVPDRNRLGNRNADLDARYGERYRDDYRRESSRRGDVARNDKIRVR